MKEQVYNFLKKYGMHEEDINFDKQINDFVADMQSGLEGNIKSMLMIPTYIGTEGDVPINEPIIVLDAGGTNLRVATVTFNNEKQPIIDNFNIYKMPGTYGELSKDEFFDIFAGYIQPVAHISNKIGFCFSFPTEILPSRDGKLIGFNKEVKVRDMAGEVIGAGINEALKKRGLASKQFVLINDTVATLLGAIACCPGKDYESYIGFILGTGTNTCYIEDCKNITKLKTSFDSAKMAVNMESGGYVGFKQGKMDVELDESTINKGEHIYEKMISGAYQGTVICLTLKQAAKDGLFSVETETALKSVIDITMREIDEFCMNTKGDNLLSKIAASKEDRELIYEIIEASFERAAKMVCINFGGIMVKTNTGKDKNKAVCISAEGTTFYKSVLFRPMLDKYIKSYLNDKLGIYCEFVKAEDSTLIGSAVAGLLN